MATEKKPATEEKPVQVKLDEQVSTEHAKEIKNDLHVQEEKRAEPKNSKATDVAVKIKNVTVKLPEDLHRKLKAKCALDGMSTGSVLRKLINDYING